MRRLLSCGVNIDIGDCRYSRTPAHIAAFAGHPHLLVYLLQAGADPNKQVSKESIALPFVTDYKKVIKYKDSSE